MKALFVTGTDTGVGKTRIAASLAAAWRRAGKRVAVMKPIETGCSEGASPITGDAGFLSAAAGARAEPSLVCPFRYRTPASPFTAARLDGLPLPDAARIIEAYRQLTPGADVAIVEGVGGLLVPVGEGTLVADLCLALGLPLLIVAPTHLGAINHTLLTLEAAHARGLRVLGVAFDQVRAPAGVEEAYVPEVIARFAPVTTFGVVPYSAGIPSTDELAEMGSSRLALQALWEAL